MIKSGEFENIFFDAIAKLLENGSINQNLDKV
jgi:hypothetical protein